MPNSEGPEERPWWHAERTHTFGGKVKNLETPELRGLNEEIQGAVVALQSQIEAESYELQVVRDLARELGPAVAFDADRFAEAIAGRYSIELEDANQMVDSFDWWQRARKALGFMKQKQGIVNGEIARRRAHDAEQVVFVIKGKISKAAMLLAGVKTRSAAVAEARKLVGEANSELDKVGP